MRSRQTASGKRLPPFAKAITDKQQGIHPGGTTEILSPYLFVGSDAWGQARQHGKKRLVTLLPPGENPETFDWRFLANESPPLPLILCGEVDGAILLRLVQAVLNAGVSRILELPTGNRYIAEVCHVD